MNKQLRYGIAAAAILAASTFGAAPAGVDPHTMSRIGTVDERFQSFNVEMVEVVGGRFWAPYRSASAAAEKAPAAALATPGIDPSLFRTRPPIDLSTARLRKLAGALGPAYMRVSGTWANSTYFQDSDAPAPATAPDGFGNVLTRRQWRGVIDFSRTVDAPIVTSFAISAGVRDDKGVWTPREAAKLLAFTKTAGGRIAAAELFNEPNMAAMGGAPKGYDAGAYGKDFNAFVRFAKNSAPDMLILGPGSVSEASLLGGLQAISSRDMLTAAGHGIDAFSYHFYGAVSKRCASLDGPPQAAAEKALSEDWLSRTDRDEAFYAELRYRFEPGKPLWLTETAESACGGNPWASSFIDSFRYLDQLGRLAKKGVQVVMHNTLAASDYGLIDEATLTPRPNYWSALLWRKLMDKTVLDAGASPLPQVHLYAHCLRNQPGGVALLAINADRTEAHGLTIPQDAARYALSATAEGLLASAVQLNGKELKLDPQGNLPPVQGTPIKAGAVTLAPASITFLAFPRAGNAVCAAQ